MKKRTKGLGRLVFMEWLIPVLDYYSSVRKNEAVFEVLVPLIIAVISSCIYGVIGKITTALDALANLLPSAISILIGFTVMFITLLFTSETPAINKLKAEKTENAVHGEYITLYQKLHIQLTESLFSEIILLLATFSYLFYKGIGSSFAFEAVMLTVEVYLTLHVLLGIIRSMTHLYCVFYGKIVDNSKHQEDS